MERGEKLNWNKVKSQAWGGGKGGNKGILSV